MTIALATPHRPDIQALRAIAIMLVIAGHAQIFGLSGGFIGVDVFFVLSGYLITGLIATETLQRRQFDALGFYLRRLKRLYPALIVMIAISAAAAWLLMSPLRQTDDALAGQSAVLWLSNFYFAAHDMNYFAPGVAHNLFLHTWSLAVEEQFYLVWPWILLFALGIWRWQGAPFSLRRLVIGIALISVASFALNLYWQNLDPRMDFYLMPSRIWEFGLGALVFFFRAWITTEKNLAQTEDGGRQISTLLVNWLYRQQGHSRLNGIGVLLILLAALIYPADLRYPGAWALLPALGAALFLLDAPDAQRGARGFYWLNRSAPVQFLGNISYSLYLWHWPLFVMGFGIFGLHTPLAIGLIGLTLVSATGSYYFVEQPFRRRVIRRRYIALLLFIGLGAGAYAGLSYWQKSIQQELASPNQAQLMAVGFDSPVIYSQPSCDTWYHNDAVTPCTFGKPAAKHTLVLFGDSVLAQWYPAFAAIYLKSPDWKITVFTKSACSASTVSYRYDRIKSDYTICDRWRAQAIKDIAALKPDLVVMGSTHYGFTDQQWIDGTRRTLAGLSPSSKTIAVMMPTPELALNGPVCLAAQRHWPHWLPNPYTCSSLRPPQADAHLLRLLQTATASFTNARVLNLQSAVCPQHTCVAEREGKITYRDSQHLTASFVKTLAPALIHALQANQFPLPKTP